MKSIGILIVGLILGALAMVCVYIYVQNQKMQSTPVNVYDQTPPSGEESTEQVLGVIEGSLSYPSEGIPKELEVCAREVNTQKQYCTDTQIKDPKYTYGVGYMLDVPEGVYNVYAQFAGTKEPVEPTGRAFYSEFVTCGLKASCTSHEPIDVAVTSGEVSTEIDPQDWYNTNPIASPNTEPTL